MSKHPYRAQTIGPAQVMRVFPGLSKQLLLLLLVIAVAPTALQIFLWSRVVQIECDKIAIELQRWPFAPKRMDFDLRSARSVELGADLTTPIHLYRARSNLFLILASGERVHLAYARPDRAQQIALALTAFLKES